MTMSVLEYTQKDFKSDNEVRWCPGCGDHAILNSIQKAMATLGIKHEDFAVISGIGCSSRFPYYMSTYGFHTIHGRAAAVASGVKCANPKLCVWEITGDGDALAIGGNHFIHIMRRNIDINLVMFNNKIYGLTKGQYSPTSDRGAVTKTSPMGTIENPFNPGLLALGAGATFYGRAVDTNIKHSQEVFEEAAKHKGTSFVEVLQNCVIFNDGIHAAITDSKTREERQIFLKHGELMIFGINRDKGLVFDKGLLKVVRLGEDGVTEKDLLVHDATEPNGYVHHQLINMKYPEFPIAMGVIRAVEAPVYDEQMELQIEDARKKSKITSIDELLSSGNTWEVE